MSRLDGAVLGDPLANPAADELLRTRLIDQFAGRWEADLVQVSAQAGFGKSTALGQALRDNASDPSGQDVLVACRTEESDIDEVLLRALHALRPILIVPQTTAALIEALIQAVSGFSPNHVCLIFDDVHRLSGEDAGPTLGTLLDAMPANGHLMLSGRWLPELPAASLREKEIHSLDHTDLAFTASEVAQLENSYDVDTGALATMGGWPASIGLARTLGPEAGAEALVGEVLQQLNDEQKRALTTVVLARRANDALIAEVAGVTTTTHEMLHSVPLLVDHGDGWIGPHDIWAEAVDQLLADPELAALRPPVISWLLNHRQPDTAIQLAASLDDWDQARRGVMLGLALDVASIPPRQLAGWLALFPQSERSEPELVALKSRLLRKQAGPRAGFDECQAAFEEFRARGQVDDEIEMLVDFFTRSWENGEPQAIFEIFGRLNELVDDGVERLTPLKLTSLAGLHDISGEPELALQMLQDVPEESVLGPAWRWRGLVWQITLNLLIGDGEAALGFLEPLEKVVPPRVFARQTLMAHWLTGDPSQLRNADFLTNPPQSHKSFDREGFLNRIYGASIAASIGVIIPTEDLKAMTGHARDEAFCAVAQAAMLVAKADEAGAARRMRDYFEIVDPDVPLGMNELRRFLPLTYVLSATVRQVIDNQDLGALHLERRALAELFLGARSGRQVNWDNLDVAKTFTAFPLRWSMELACRAEHNGHEVGQRLTDYLMDWTGAAGRDILRDLATATDRPVADGAAALIKRIPTPPDHALEVLAFGPVRCVGAKRSDDQGDLKRLRVRQLLSLIILRGDVTRDDALNLLWPGKDPDAARNNLRVTLSYLRKTLEPDRLRNEAHFHLREHDRYLALRDSELLSIDVTDALDAIKAGRKAEAERDLVVAIKHFSYLLDLVTAAPLPDLRNIDELGLELVALDQMLWDGLGRLGELALAEGDNAMATQAGVRLLTLDPYSERASRILISAALDDGAIDEAAHHAAACLDVLGELDVEPTAETRMVLRRLELRQRHRPSNA